MRATPLRACRNPKALPVSTPTFPRSTTTMTTVTAPSASSTSSLGALPIRAARGAPKQHISRTNHDAAARQLATQGARKRPFLFSASSSPSASSGADLLLSSSDDKESKSESDAWREDPPPPVKNLGDAAADATPVVSLGALLRFAAPTAAIWVVGPTLGLIDAAVVGTRSSLELAALGPGTVLCDYTSYIFTFLAVATTNMLSLRFARGDGEGASGALNDSLTVSLWLGVALAAATLISAPKLLDLLVGTGGSSNRDIIAPALSYVQIRAFGAPFALVGFVAQAFFLAALDAKTPLAAAALAGMLNLFGDVILVCGLGWGIAGAALATVAAQAAAAAYLLVSLRRPLRAGTAGPPPDAGALARGHKRWSPRVSSLIQMISKIPSRDGARELFGYAGPVVALLATKVALYSACAARAAAGAGGGAPGAAAHHVAVSAFLFFACAGDAVCAGAQSFLPPAIGSPRRAAAVGKGLLKAGVAAGAANAALAGAALTAAALPGAFTTCEATRVILASVAPVAAATLGLHCASMATEGMLLAARDLKFQTAANFFNVGLCLSSLWLLTAASSPFLRSSSALFPLVSSLGLRAIWLVLFQFQGIRLFLNGMRLWGSGNASPLRWTRPLKVGVA